MTTNRSVAVMMRTPEQGQVKSRLMKAFDSDFVLGLYKCFVLDTLKTLKKARLPFTLFFTPPGSEGTLTAWLGAKHPLQPQEGNDLGERLLNAFIFLYNEGFERVLALGSDTPDLPASLINEAFSALKEMDSVVGPALDGGYYLIGFRKDRFLPQVFQGIDWGTAKVCEQTLEILKRSGLAVKSLPCWMDIDNPEDVATLFTRGKHTSFAASETMGYLVHHQKRLL